MSKTHQIISLSQFDDIEEIKTYNKLNINLMYYFIYSLKYSILFNNIFNLQWRDHEIVDTNAFICLSTLVNLNQLIINLRCLFILFFKINKIKYWILFNIIFNFHWSVNQIVDINGFNCLSVLANLNHLEIYLSYLFILFFQMLNYIWHYFQFTLKIQSNCWYQCF